jgi:hypothetical protein
VGGLASCDQQLQDRTFSKHFGGFSFDQIFFVFPTLAGSGFIQLHTAASKHDVNG